MTAPIEFSPDYVATHSPVEAQLYSGFYRSGEPFKSLFADRPWLHPPDLKQPLQWGTGAYWDTHIAREHPYWQAHPLPQACKDIRQLRADLKEWGYCLIEDGMSATQCATFITRLREQAAGERAAGIADMTPSGQYVNTLINKGRCFGQCIEQDPAAVQAGPVIEQLINETLGRGWICHSFLANGADPGGYPQGLHIDQGPLAPWITEQAPALVNTMYIPQDVDAHNGGTLLIPGSHKLMIRAYQGEHIDEIPPPINLEAKAGTIMIFDGRVLHGTGANRSDKQRFVATMSNVKDWMRQQENWILSVAPDVIEQASDKLLHRMGMQALTYGSTVEGYGLGARGRAGDAWGNLRRFRLAQEQGTYHRVRELGPHSSAEQLTAPYTVREVQGLPGQYRPASESKT